LTERQLGVFLTTDIHSACGPKNASLLLLE